MNFLKIKWVMPVILIITTLSLSIGTVLADSTEIKTNDQQSGPIVIIIANGANLSSADLKKELQRKLDESVANGKITREQAERILQNNLPDEQPGHKIGQGNMIISRMAHRLQPELKKELQTTLDKMMVNGKITREQADEVLQYVLDDQQPGRKFYRQFTVINPTGNQLLTELKKELQTQLDEMAACGKITKEQANEILQNAFIHHQSDPEMAIAAKINNLAQEELPDMLRFNLDEMVADGKITRAQADEILLNTKQ